MHNKVEHMIEESWVPEPSVNECLMCEWSYVISDSKKNACVSAHPKLILQWNHTSLKVVLKLNLFGPSIFIQNATSTIICIRAKQEL